MTPTEVIPGHIIETVDATIGVLHDAVTPVLIVITMAHHIKDHPPIGVLQLIPKIAADPDHVLHIKQVRKLCINLHPILGRTPARAQDRRYPCVMIDDPQTDFYNTDDNSSDSKDDEGHLN